MPDAREAARLYLQRAYQAIPIAKGSKNPNRQGWQGERRTEEHLPDFVADGNLGLLLGEPSHGLVDVDIDCAEALVVADLLLPSTSMVHGRASAQQAHRWYVCAGAKTQRFKDFDGTTLVELRSTGGQTIVPPSFHPEGEQIEWEGGTPGEPAVVDHAALQGGVRRLAAAALLARHWPAQGSRHDAALALAGYLLHGGIRAEDANLFIRAVAIAAHDNEVDDRVDAVESTTMKITSGATVTGGPTLASIIDARVTVRAAAWLGLTPRRVTAAQKTSLGTSGTTSTGQEPIRLTESWLAELVVKEHGQDLRYSGEQGTWYAWDGRRWSRDRSGRLARMVKAAIRELRIEAVKTSNENLEKFAKSAEKRRAREDVAMLARYEPEVQVLVSELDQDPYLLNVKNGTVNLRTGRLQPHRHEDLITKWAPVEFKPDAKCPRWDEFINRIFEGDEQVISYVQKIAGYLLTGDVSEQILIICAGSGANGKSTLLLILLIMLGDYGRAGAPDLLLARKHEQHPTELADLFGARLVLCQESSEGARLDESKVKGLTGGDKIKGRRMREDFWEFSPTHKLVLCTNHLPQIRGNDHAIWRRVRLLPFGVTIPDAEQDPELIEKLREELPGILAWAVRGCLAWQEDGLWPPKVIQDATSGYRDEQDVVGRWIGDCCIIGAQCRADSSALYRSFKAWAEEQNEFVLSNKILSQKLAERGFGKGRDRRARFFLGIGLLDERVTDDDASSRSSPRDPPLGGDAEEPSPCVTRAGEFPFGAQPRDQAPAPSGNDDGPTVVAPNGTVVRIPF